MSRYDFTTEPLEYANRLLQRHTLSRALGESFDLSKGVFHTYLPPNISLEEALKFTRGKREEQKFRAEENGFTDPYDMVIAEISRFLTQHQSSIFCVEEALGQATDPWFTKESNPIKNSFIFENELYHYAHSKKFEEDDIEELLASVVDWAYVGVLAVVDETVFDEGIHEISELQMSAIVRGTRKIVFGAYERESFLFWEPDSN